MADRPSGAGSVSEQLGFAAPPARRRGIRALGRHKWITVAAIVAATFLAAIYSHRQAPLFTSSSRIMFAPSLRSDLPGKPATTGFETYLQAQAQLLNSEPVLAQAAAALHQKHLKSPYEIEVDLSKDDGIITVSAVTPVAADSAAIVNAVIKAYQNYTSQQGPAADREMLRFLQTEKDQHDLQLTTALRQLSDFKIHHPDTAFADANGANIIFVKLAKLNDELTDAQSTLLNLNAKYAAAAALIPPDPSSAATTQDAGVSTADDLDADLSWVQSELGRTAASLDALSSRGVAATDQNFVDAKAYENRLRQKLITCQRAIGLSKLAGIKQQQDLAQRHEIDLQKAVDDQKAAAADLNSQLVEFTRLSDEVTRAEKADGEVDARLKNLTIATESIPQIRVLEPARPADHPQQMSARLLGFAAAAGLLLGICLSLGLDLLDTRLRSPDEVRNLLGLAILGILPQLRGEPTGQLLGMMSHSDAMSPFADAVRRVRAAIFAASRSTPVKTILVTSPSSAEGKSIFIANLAIVMAQAGGRTLLIDANYGAPGLSKTFDLQGSAGLSDVISGKFPAEQAIHRTPVEGLEVLTCGAIVSNPADMLNSKAFTKLIQQLSEKYRCILIDSPPVLSSTDARILASHADLTLLVVRTGTTVRKAADQALDQLLSVGSRVLGTVVNGYTTGKQARRIRSTLPVDAPQQMMVDPQPAAISSDRSIVTVGDNKTRMTASKRATG